MSEVTAPAKSASPWTRSNPFPGKLVVNRRLSGPESEKDTRHFEVDLTGWGLSFEVGDSVAVYPTNDPALVDEILHALGAKGNELVTAAKTQKSFRDALLKDFSRHTTDSEIFACDHGTGEIFEPVEGFAACFTQGGS